MLYPELFKQLESVRWDMDKDIPWDRFETLQLSDEQARETATGIWERINQPNLVDNVLPTRERATLVLTKGADHAGTRIRLRKI